MEWPKTIAVAALAAVIAVVGTLFVLEKLPSQSSQAVRAHNGDLSRPIIQARYRKLLDFFKENPVAFYGDWGVFKINAEQQSEPVVAVFGFGDNKTSCQDIASRFNADEPNSYHCEPLQ